MVKNNLNLEYYNRYDFIQTTKQSSVYIDGNISKLKVTFVDKTSNNDNLNSQIKSFLYCFLFNEQIVKLNKQIVQRNKIENVSDSFSFECQTSSKGKIAEILKQLYFFCFNRNSESSVIFSKDKRNGIVKVVVPLTTFLQLNELQTLVSLDFKNIHVSLEFFLTSKNLEKHDLNKIFPFWMNG